MSLKETAKRIGPVLNKWTVKFSSNMFVKTIAAGMARLLPVTIVGSVITLIGSIPYEPYLQFLEQTGIKGYLTLGDTMTNGIITIYLVIALAYEMAKNYKKSQINAICISIVAFFLITPLTTFAVKGEPVQAFTLTYLGSRGMFVGMITALIATRLYVLFMDKGFKIKMHPSVPPAISGSFESLFPIVIISILFIGISAGFSLTAFGDAHSFIYTILQKPLEGASGSLSTMLIICFIGELFWWFGIHGSNVTSAVTNTLYLPLAIANAQALATGQSPEFILNSYFLNIYKGPRHLALACMLLWLTHSKQLKAIGKVAVVPGVFGISEPMKFGIPMVYNPIIFVPMTLAPVMCISIAYFATIIGFLPVVGINLPWSMPPIIGGFLAGGFAGVTVQVIQFVACLLLYYPFLKMLDRQKVNAEEITERELASKGV
ncbi:PTS sugar transporter subunit IIC [Enterococcus rivorum]|uniref:Permease IIC component n=1 Tax=Enterococcus rivorum TaxID=762845 RepID=A0A1E5L1M3_9ENTE|nr:PTS transporter subunit EIIC [Enterococcus rivorum]MBP2097725.1 PTS system cellobiose-specific IIC component [Enterococcus rivorum]OEH83994.1 hypothetical protein BCR26_00545 [Enterococcus rivorum]